LPKEYPAGGDTLFEWVRFVFLLALAAVGASVWSVLDRRRVAYPLLLDLLRTYVRYGLAFTMLFYAIVKVFPIQFTAPSLNHLLQPFGDFSPMGLLWTFMGFSRPYAIGSGLVEWTGAALLFWRRTTFLGALLLAGATANVLALNLCFDVPVKLYSAHLLLMALFLAAPDGVRLLRGLLLREAIVLPPLREPVPWPVVDRARPWVKAVLIAWCSFATVYFTVKQSAASSLPARPALYGVWLVESYEPLAPGGTAWHHVVIDEWGGVTVERANDERTWFDLADEPSTSSVKLTRETAEVRLTYARADEDHVVLDGALDGQHVTIRMRRVKKDFLLTSRGFHWTQEEGLNR
jgi:hypothetical protein